MISGFDFYWREPDQIWRGPFVVAGDATVGPVTQGLSTGDTVADLTSVGINFTVPEGILRGFLANPDFTPYPSLAAALLQQAQDIA